MYGGPTAAESAQGLYTVTTASGQTATGVLDPSAPGGVRITSTTTTAAHPAAGLMGQAGATLAMAPSLGPSLGATGGLLGGSSAASLMGAVYNTPVTAGTTSL